MRVIEKIESMREWSERQRRSDGTPHIGLDWFVALLFPPDLVQIKAASESGIVRQHFDAGEAVFHQGDLGDNVYVIEKGQVAVLRGEEHVADLGAGDYFGEMAVLGNVSRNAS